MENVNEFVQQRIDKLNALKEIGVEVYGRRFNKAQSVDELVRGFKEGDKVETAGRITALREHGKSAFLDLRDASGRVQIYVKANIIGVETFNSIFKKLDIGD
ncbi:MAG: lysine--tRNA ligase, partial [Candidatus Omnitrophica bacterium]|nr:lysine--tRNA ligase [Candidatus Omnitrophota bacterium]